MPHVLHSTNGVQIETKCDDHSASNMLRLTGDHLVYTSKVLQAASTVVVGDVLFGNFAESKQCHVIRIDKGKADEPQLYFGLNCHESVVLADGLKTSTFGRYHMIPAAWMKLGSKVLGIERASRWGDYIAQWLNSMKLL